MATKKTKKLSEQTSTTIVASGEKFAKVDANGKVTLIDLANLKTALLGNINLDCMMDGAFIMYHRKLDNFPLMVKPHKWTALQNAGEIADGVVVVEGGRMLVVAPTEADVDIMWSSAEISGGATTTGDRITAMADWSGKANTAAIISKSTASAVTNTSAYAPGFCNLYSRANANGKGLLAGKWWLPSAGEMMMIYANLTKINYCLSLIAGAIQLRESCYWTSTESSAKQAWHLYLSGGDISLSTKASHERKVRPVSAFIS